MDRGVHRRWGAFAARSRGGGNRIRGQGDSPQADRCRMGDRPGATGREDWEELGAGRRLRGEWGGPALDGGQGLQWEGPPPPEGRPTSTGRRGRAQEAAGERGHDWEPGGMSPPPSERCGPPGTCPRGNPRGRRCPKDPGVGERRGQRRGTTGQGARS